MNRTFKNKSYKTLIYQEIKCLKLLTFQQIYVAIQLFCFWDIYHPFFLSLCLFFCLWYCLQNSVLELKAHVFLCLGKAFVTPGLPRVRSGPGKTSHPQLQPLWLLLPIGGGGTSSGDMKGKGSPPTPLPWPSGTSASPLHAWESAEWAGDSNLHLDFLVNSGGFLMRNYQIVVDKDIFASRDIGSYRVKVFPSSLHL